MTRGEVWWVDLGYAAKTRPCLVLSIAALDQDRALVTVIPHTTQQRGTRFEVDVKTPFLLSGAFDAQSPITVSPAKFGDMLGKLTPEQVDRIERSVRLWLGL